VDNVSRAPGSPSENMKPIPPFWVIKKLFYLCDTKYKNSFSEGNGIAIIEQYEVHYHIKNIDSKPEISIVDFFLIK